MFFDFFPPRFLKEVAICNGELVAAIIIYNLLVYLVPLIRLSLGAALLIIVVVNLILFGLKFLHYQSNQ
ncbi:hypothetical protein [Limosilactobacillus sp.]|uniref:hypothetical protein n=1 Tax=Limosilactobacillus sp. TaxID=2773925 RepID=UPI003F022939